MWLPYCWSKLWEQIKAVLPVLCLLIFFQVAVLQVGIVDAGIIAVGMSLVVLGLAFFLEGLILGFMPLGEIIGIKMPVKTILAVILAVGFALGVGATFAEPSIGVLKASEAAVPLSFTHHGVLKEDGAPVSAVCSITATIVDQDGRKAGEFDKDVKVESGLFSLTIENIDTDIVAAASELSLKVSVNGEVLSPELKITAVPYAVASKVAQGVNTTMATAAAQYSYAKEGKALDSSEVDADNIVKCPCDKDQNANDCGEEFPSSSFNEADCYDLLGGSYYQHYVKSPIERPVEVVAVEAARIGIGTAQPDAPLHILSEEGDADDGVAVHIVDSIPRIALDNLGDQQKVVVSGQGGNLDVAGGIEATHLGEKLYAYVLDRIYPVGSIYTSTELSTAEAVHQKLGGTWVAHGGSKVYIKPLQFREV